MLARWSPELAHYADLAFLALVALALRIWGIGFDLPNLYHRDEAKYVQIPLAIVKTGDFNPHFFNYPSLFFYALSCVYVLYVLFLASQGRIGSLEGIALPEVVLENVAGRATMPSQLLVGRGLVAATGVASVLLVYWLGKRLYGRRAGMVAGLLFAVSPVHVRNSHFVAPDVTMLLLVLAAFVACLEVWHHGNRRDYVVAGILAGLAISTKYNAYAILAPLLLAHLKQRKGKSLLNSDLLLGAAACAGAFLLGTPYALLDLPAFLNGVVFELRHYSTLGDPGTEGQNALLWYARYLVRNEGLLPLLAAVEAVRLLLARKWDRVLVVAFPLVYALLVSSYAVKNDRTLMTIIPFLAILAGATVDRAITWLEPRTPTIHGRRLAWSAALCVTVAILWWPTWQTLQIDARFARDDVRTDVTLWMEEELPPGSRIAGEYYSPLLTNSRHRFRWVDRAIDLPLSWYVSNADYVVLVENRYGGFYLDPARYAAQVADYEEMLRQFKLVREFQGGALGNPCRAAVYQVSP